MKKKTTKTKKSKTETSILSEVAAIVGKKSPFECEQTTDGLVVKSGLEGTIVSVETVDKEMPDGLRLAQVARLVSKVPTNRKFKPEEFLKLNKLSAMGAAWEDGDGESITLASRISVYESSESERALIAHLLALASTVNIHACFGAGAAKLNVAVAMKILRVPSVWSQKDFTEATLLLRTAGLEAFNSMHELSVQIPLKPEILPETAMLRTSLLRFSRLESHPNLGGGLFYMLELPMKFSEQQLIEYSRFLNEMEFAALDAPPMIGAWTGMLEKNSLVHIGFLPNISYWPGIVSNIAFWMVKRNEIACAAVEYLLKKDEKEMVRK